MNPTNTPSFYDLYIAEIDALTITADMTAAQVVGICTRAAKRAELVHDGDLPPITVRVAPKAPPA